MLLIFLSVTAPLEVLGVTGTRRDEYTMMITWPRLTDSQARGPIMWYYMQYGPYDGTYSQILETQKVYLEELPKTVPGLELTQSYYIQVLGTNPAGNGTFSTPIIVPSKQPTCFARCVESKLCDLEPDIKY